MHARKHARELLTAAVLIATVLGAASAARSQGMLFSAGDAGGAGSAATPALPLQPPRGTVDPRIAEKLSHPRSTVELLLEAMHQDRKDLAVRTLDLTHLDPVTAAAKGESYAYRLKEILDRMVDLDPRWIADDADQHDRYVLGDDLEVAGRLSAADREDARRIVLDRSDDGLWRFSSETVGAIDELWSRWRQRPLVAGDRQRPTPTWDVWIESQFPERLQSKRFLLRDYQWILVGALIFLGFLADLCARGLLLHLTRAWIRYFDGGQADPVEWKLWRPVGLLAQALVWYGGTRIIGLPDVVSMVLLLGLKFFAVLASVWTAFLAVDIVSQFLARKAQKTQTRFDDLLIPLLSKSLKVLAVVVGVLTCAEAFDLPVMGLLGGLGLVGAALALASKDAIANFFGSVTVLVDRPFEIGDWVITQGVEGTVEAVGFRSTRIRTFYNSLITVPNSLLTTAVVDNMGRRRYRRIKTTLNVQYDTTPAQIEAFCEGIRELIRRHPYTRKDFYHVYFNDLSDSALNILLYCFVECPSWPIELRERHRLLLDIVRLARQLHVQFAFPTRTLHLYQHAPAEDGNGLHVELDDPLRAGQRLAARVAGAPVPPDRRPGPVEFPGPTPIEMDERAPGNDHD